LVDALSCLQEKVVDDPLHLDAAFVYGIGFPAFRGGLLRYFAGCDAAELQSMIKQQGYEIPVNMVILDGFR